MIKVGIIGVGTVGSHVVKILRENEDIITARTGKKIVPVLGVVRDLNKPREVDLPLSDSVDAVLENPEIDVVVELMGGVEEAYAIVTKALKHKKAVVTANKALLAYHRYELKDLAGETPIGYEASVAGGIPIIKALREGLSANHIEAIKGIMNGTCNFILTKMMNEKAEFADVLKEAQALGYAEADPSFDVGGFDAAHKLLILASIAYGIDVKPEEILIEGIEQINSEDIYFAKEFGYNIKLLTIAKKSGDQVELRVHPALVPMQQMIAKVDGVMNGISVIGDRVGETMYYGPGAGGSATASAVVSDLIDIARHTQNSPMLGFISSLEKSGLTLMCKDDIATQYYIRVSVIDKIGVLSKISEVLGKHSISISSFIQKQDSKKSECAVLLFSTHTCKEKDIQKALCDISDLEFVERKPTMIRIES
ncbi:MAG: homoserine dehydrogenase [Epsilonproteobacteria bacterium]|uniref:Homoserine dehydrogenase n=1 Tax=Sulfurospirillum cavolei TaxID=366522 RepID=A0A2D3WK45_9BACT|nr:homoserine dehydrogenase [Sulfurospirillum cavolei]NCB53435.1 homoserine dehydrogenase [Campylobacterota bacterium]DAB36903.1 MAG TPA: homoserine dehydrogenase [Sulfurospirillum cavolei]